MVKLFSRRGGRKPEGLNPEGLRQATRGDWRKDRRGSAEELREQGDRLHELAVLGLFLHSAGTLERRRESPRGIGIRAFYTHIIFGDSCAARRLLFAQREVSRSRRNFLRPRNRS